MAESESPDKRPTTQRHPTLTQRAWRNWGDHPVVAIFTIVASVATIIGLFQRGKTQGQSANMGATPPGVGAPAPTESTPPRPAPDEPPSGKCADVAGRWDWLTTGGVVAIAETGTMKWYRVATDPFPTVNGTWECSPRNPRHLTLRWIETQLVDTIVLSRDGKRFSGANLRSGFLLSGTREK